jgi:hypothetical protein
MESDTFGDDPVCLPWHKAPVMGTAAAASDAVVRRKLTAWGQWRAGTRSGPRLTSRFRTETGLAPKDRDRWYCRRRALCQPDPTQTYNLTAHAKRPANSGLLESG